MQSLVLDGKPAGQFTHCKNPLIPSNDKTICFGKMIRGEILTNITNILLYFWFAVTKINLKLLKRPLFLKILRGTKNLYYCGSETILPLITPPTSHFSHWVTTFLGTFPRNTTIAELSVYSLYIVDSQRTITQAEMLKDKFRLLHRHSLLQIMYHSVPFFAHWFIETIFFFKSRWNNLVIIIGHYAVKWRRN